jgi:hypothetical protein
VQAQAAVPGSALLISATAAANGPCGTAVCEAPRKSAYKQAGGDNQCGINTLPLVHHQVHFQFAAVAISVSVEMVRAERSAKLHKALALI